MLINKIVVFIIHLKIFASNKKDLANIDIMLKLSDYDNQFNDDEYYLETKVELQLS